MANQPSVETLKAVLDAFNDHDLDRIMSFFSEDCVLEMPRGPDPWGSRSVWCSRREGGAALTLHRHSRCELRRRHAFCLGRHRRVAMDAARHQG